MNSPRALVLEDGSLAVFWLESPELRMAVLDASGAITTDPKTVASGSSPDLISGKRTARSPSFVISRASIEPRAAT